VPDICNPMLKNLQNKGFQVHLLNGNSDIPIPFMAVFLQHKTNSSNCSVAFGSYPDPTLALERALTEAVQMLPPSVNHRAWLKSGAPQFYQSGFPDEIDFSSIENAATNDIKKNIEICVSILKNIGSEVFVVDLSHPDIPFPAVRVLATQLQPRLNKDSMRISDRFFEVPAKLGFRSPQTTSSEVKLWSICGYR
jgi:ribosomal protein S12 methylthiotransferase accessory factor YcaO